MIEKFVTRLQKIGIDVELIGNYPWVYLASVNGEAVKEQFQAEHGFTAFFMPVKHGGEVRFSDRRRVFEKIRKTARGK